MNKHSSIGVVGTWAKVIGEKTKRSIKTYSDLEKIKSVTLFKNPMIHPSIIMKKALFNKHDLRYNKNYKHAEDYELWTRVIKYFPISNIKKVLFLYRKHKENTSRTYLDTVLRCSTTIKLNQLQSNFNIFPNKEEILIHQNIYKPNQYQITDFLNKAELWLNKLIAQNKQIQYYKEPQFSMVLADRWLNICNINSNYDFGILRRFWKSPLRKKMDWADMENWKILIRFFSKCLLKKKI